MRHVRRAVPFLFVTLWGGAAAASRPFPPQVDTHLKLTGANTIENIAPPDGCLLCHTTEVGGLGTLNSGFGAQMKQNGAVAAETPTVDLALDSIEAINPRAIDDIIMGINPNDDHTTQSVALPSPRYGCSASPSRASGPAGGTTALLLLVPVFARLVRRRPKAPELGE